MRALFVTRHGPPEVLQVREAPDPKAGDGEIRIRVARSGINFADIAARLGIYPGAPKPPGIVGYEVAGIVESIGRGAQPFKEGDRVLAFTMFGGNTDLLCVPAQFAQAIPDAMSFDQAAAIPVNYLTAYHALFSAGRVRAKDR